MISGYLGDDDTFGRAIERFVERYADLHEVDHAAHEEAAASGRIEAITGV